MLCFGRCAPISDAARRALRPKSYWGRVVTCLVLQRASCRRGTPEALRARPKLPNHEYVTVTD